MDFLPLEQLRNVQLKRMQAIVARAYDNVTLFRQRMKERDLTPASVQTMDDVALLGMLSASLAIPEEHWLAALRANLPEKIFEVNRQAFALGRQQKTT